MSDAPGSRHDSRDLPQAIPRRNPRIGGPEPAPGELYFLIDGLLDRLIVLSYGLAAIRAFIAAKLILPALHENNVPFIDDGQPVGVVEIGTGLSLGVIQRAGRDRARLPAQPQGPRPERGVRATPRSSSRTRPTPRAARRSSPSSALKRPSSIGYRRNTARGSASRTS